MMRPDHVCGLVAEEQRRQHVNLEVRRGVEFAEGFVDGLHHALHVALQVLERRFELKIRDDPLDGRGETVLAGVIRAISRLGRGLVVLDVFGRDGRAHENEVVIEVRTVQDLAAHGVEERLGAFRLAMRGEQADVMQLDLLPDFVVDIFRVVFVLKQRDAFIHAVSYDAMRSRASCCTASQSPASKHCLAAIAASRKMR